jgi:hypothetical protein
MEADQKPKTEALTFTNMGLLTTQYVFINKDTRRLVIRLYPKDWRVSVVGDMSEKETMFTTTHHDYIFDVKPCTSTYLGTITFNDGNVEKTVRVCQQ